MKGGMVGKDTAGGTLQDDRIELTVAGAARSATPQEKQGLLARGRRGVTTRASGGGEP